MWLLGHPMQQRVKVVLLKTITNGNAILHICASKIFFSCRDSIIARN